jgi:hypothetical protein
MGVAAEQTHNRQTDSASSMTLNEQMTVTAPDEPADSSARELRLSWRLTLLTIHSGALETFPPSWAHRSTSFAAASLIRVWAMPSAT